MLTPGWHCRRGRSCYLSSASTLTLPPFSVSIPSTIRACLPWAVPGGCIARYTANRRHNPRLVCPRLRGPVTDQRRLFRQKQQRQMRDRARQKRKEGAERYEGFCSTGQTHCSAALIRLFSVRGGGGLETSIGNREDVGYTQTKTYT